MIDDVYLKPWFWGGELRFSRLSLSDYGRGHGGRRGRSGSEPDYRKDYGATSALVYPLSAAADACFQRRRHADCLGADKDVDAACGLCCLFVCSFFANPVLLRKGAMQAMCG